MKPIHSVVAASLWMTGTLFSFAAMAVGGRELSQELSTFQILFYRSLVGLFIVLGIVRFNSRGKAGFWLPTRKFGLHAVRNLAHFGGQFGWFYGIAYISLAEVFAIEFTLPVWTAILALVLLGERLTGPRLVAVGLGITGMLIILRPGLGVMNTASLAVLFGAICYALSHTLTKKITRYDPPLTILFYMTLIQLPIGFALSIEGFHIPGLSAWPWVLVVGVTALSGHYCMARALKIAPATVVVPMDFLRLPLIAFVGFMIYNESLDVFVFIGALVMLGGNLVNVRAEQKSTG
ncbi:MAG: DMT family transporter [Desulfobacterales bacterium]|nr:DMT family transporter [Desulfobacterales bacterium]